MKLVLPYPPSELLPNRKTPRWSNKKKGIKGERDATKEYREACGWYICEQVGNFEKQFAWESVSFFITLYPKDGRVADPDSFHRSLKPGIDAIVDAGIIKDDSFKIIKQVTLRYGGVDRTNPRVEIDIVEVI